MRTLVIKIEIDIPDGVAVSVGSGAASGAAPTAPQSHAAPLPALDDAPWPLPPPDLTNAASQIFDGMGDLVAHPSTVLHDQAAEWPPGRCPRHDRAWISNARGLYCPAKATDGPHNPKGYCTLVPGQVWEGRRIPGAP